MKIGSCTLANKLPLATMAGVADVVFHKLCRQHGVAYSITEMISSDRHW